jgi:hypothetical protein
VKFAALPAPVGDPAFDSSVSPDGRAVTMTFSDFIATADASKSPERTATRALSVIVPLENPDPTTAIEFGVSGFVATTLGADATLLVSVNGQSRVIDFAGGADRSFVESFRFGAEAPAECRLLILLLAGRETDDATAFVNVLAIDAEVLPRPGDPGPQLPDL